jgi:RecA-family ATPase
MKKHNDNPLSDEEVNKIFELSTPAAKNKTAKKVSVDSSQDKNFSEDKYSGLSLFNLEFNELPKLIDPIFPQTGLVSLVGSSDTGKSTLLRQLALSIALGLDNFVGYKIGAKANKVIYVSTEDDAASTSISLKKQINGLFPNGTLDPDALNNIKFIFDTTNSEDKDLITQLSDDLENIGADLIIIDAFTDVFSGDLNSSTKVREFLKSFNDLAKEYKCLILFLHHTGKRTDKFSASKDNVLGSQAFEAKMRVLLELKQYPNDDKKRTLTITKGNYISSEIKKYAKVLQFDEDTLLFSEFSKIPVSSISSIARTNPKKDEIMPLIMEMHKQKKPLRYMEKVLESKGYDIKKSTIGNYIKMLDTKSDNIIEKDVESK